MSEPTQKPPRHEPSSLSSTLFLSGICIALGWVSLLVGLGVFPTGTANISGLGYLLAIGTGLLFIFAGIMVIVRDFAGARNREEIPPGAHPLLRVGEQVISIVLIAIFAAICSVIAFGPFFTGGAAPDAGSFGGTVFRIVMALFAIVLWYAAIYLAISRLKHRA